MSTPANRLRSPLKIVRGLGSAKDGTTHWMQQRATAVALVPLVILFVATVLSLVGTDWSTAYTTLGNPFVATVTILLVVTVSWHLRLGLQVVVEDYVHNELQKLALIWALKGAVTAIGLLTVLAVLSMVMGE